MALEGYDPITATVSLHHGEGGQAEYKEPCYCDDNLNLFLFCFVVFFNCRITPENTPILGDRWAWGRQGPAPPCRDAPLQLSCPLCDYCHPHVHVNTLRPRNTELQGEWRTLFSVNALDSEAKLWLFPWSRCLKVILDGTDRLISPLPGTQWNDAPPKTSDSCLSFPNISPLITAQEEKQTNRGTLPRSQCFSPTHKSRICSQSTQSWESSRRTARASHRPPGCRDPAPPQPFLGYFNNP